MEIDKESLRLSRLKVITTYDKFVCSLIMDFHSIPQIFEVLTWALEASYIEKLRQRK